jgi:uncharacterized protein YrrD
MEIDIGARVFSADGNEVGQANRLVVNPNTREVLEIVVHKGTFLSRDITVPFHSVREATAGQIVLNLTAEGVRQLPDFVEELYSYLPSQQNQTGLFVFPELLYPRTYAFDATPVTTLKSAPPGSIELTEGVEVYAEDGKVGVVDEVLTDPDSAQITAFVVRRGLLLTRDIVVPISMVEHVDAQKVALRVTKDELEKTTINCQDRWSAGPTGQTVNGEVEEHRPENNIQ